MKSMQALKNSVVAIAAAVAVSSVSASQAPASGLYASGASNPFTTSGFNGIPGLGGEQSFVFGTLMSAQAGTLTFSYLGSEAGHTDKFFTFNDLRFSNKASTNSAFSLQIGAGQPLNFTFQDFTAGYSVANGATVSSWGQPNNANSWQNTFGLKKESDYSYLLMYNDFVSGGDRDFDDMVVRVVLSPVPEPGAYAMFLAGLGLVGFVARRRKAA